MTKQPAEQWLREEVEKCLTIDGLISKEFISDVYHQYAKYDNGDVWCNNIQFSLDFGGSSNYFRLDLIDNTFSCECYNDAGEATLCLPFKAVKKLIEIAEKYKELKDE